MSKLVYSSNALSVLNKFYGKEAVIYVEGQDDVCFWKSIFNMFSRNTIELKIAGSCTTLVNYCKKIIDEDAKIFVAMDRDHRDVCGQMIIHKRIIYTYGYSIENSLYCHKNILRVIHNLYRTEKDLSKCLKEWSDDFEKKSLPLILYSILNAKSNFGFKVFSDSCQSMLISKKSAFLSDDKVREYCTQFENTWSDESKNTVIKELGQKNKKMWYFVKGHFITSSVSNLIRYEAGKMLGCDGLHSLPSNMLYALMLDGCCLCCSDKECEECNYYSISIINAFSSK